MHDHPQLRAVLKNRDSQFSMMASRAREARGGHLIGRLGRPGAETARTEI
jgi:hypothetical protein